MSTRRTEGDPCPINESPLGMDVCQPCRFFRGAIRLPEVGWTINCNYPRNGSAVEREPVPEAFQRAMTHG